MTVQENPKTLHPHHLRNFLIILAIPIIIAVVVAWKGGLLSPAPKITIITSTSDPYWDRVLLGAKQAGSHFDVEVAEVRINGDEKQQSQAIQDALNNGYNGLGISPVNPVTQASLMNDVANRVSMVTIDSDCPTANRLAFIGTDNYVAGRQCAQMIRDVLPDGGDIIISVGTLDKDNGRLRRQGLIDSLLDRPLDPSRSPDPADAQLKGSKYTIVDTLVDNVDISKASQLAVDAIQKHPNLKCFAGLFGYTTPALLDALKKTGKLGQIKVVGFDEAEPTLDGIVSGQVAGTLVQDQYNMGYDTVRFLVEHLRHIPADQPGAHMEYLPCRAVTTAEDVAIIRYEKQREQSGGAGSTAPPPPTTAPTTAPVALAK
jgi:ribose transport system substrate-binding protein